MPTNKDVQKWIQDVTREAFDTYLSPNDKAEKEAKKPKEAAREEFEGNSAPFATIEEYKEVTGAKRYRMTKDQMTRGLTRNEAFSEFVKNWTH